MSRHKADGTYKAYRHGTLRRDPAQDRVQAPPHLADEERDAFELVVKYLEHAGVAITYADSFVIERAALALVDAHAARQVVRGLESRTYESKYGESLHPAVRDERQAWADFVAAAKGLGLNPMDREKLHAGEVGEDDPLDAFEKGGRAKLRSVPAAGA